MEWRYEIKIKHLFEDETTPELVKKLCTKLVQDLDKVLENSQKSNISENSIDDFWYDLEGCRDNFDFLLKLSNEEIEEDEWNDYNFDGDFEGEFNSYLSELYDIADRTIALRNGKINKLLWVG